MDASCQMNTYAVPHSSVAGFLEEKVLREGRAPPGSCAAFYDFILEVMQHQSDSIPLVRSGILGWNVKIC